MEKTGMVESTIVKWIIALAFLAVIIGAMVWMKTDLGDLGTSIINLLKFGN